VNKSEGNEVRIKRNLAILKLAKICEKNNSNTYTSLDFILDRVLREFLGLPRKSAGKPPYEFLDS
jgi:hypothetical protein